MSQGFELTLQDNRDDSKTLGGSYKDKGSEACRVVVFTTIIVSKNV